MTDYDACNRKIWQTTNHYSEKVPDQGYDPLGNLLKVEREGVFPVQDSLYQYDALSQLVLEQSGFTKTYAHDSLNNCRLFNGEDRISNALNQFTESANQKCSYSPQGALSQKTVCARESLFTHDVLLQLVTIETDNHTTIRSTYDPFGRRIGKKVFWNKGDKEVLISSSDAFYLGYHEMGTYDENEKMQELRIPGLSFGGLS